MKYRLEEIADVTMGQSPKSQYYNRDGKGYPFLQGNRTFGFKRPVFDTYTTVMTKPAYAGDVIMSVRAPVGDLNITPVDMCLGRGVCSLRMKNGNQQFLFYMMKYYIQQLLNKESGTVFGSVNRNDINGLEVDIPSDDELQGKIARYLSMIDDKIELNMAINDNLERQTDLLFEKIFADDTDFVELGSVVETTSGGTPSRKNPELYRNPSIPWVKSKELIGNFIHDTEEKINEEALIKSAAKLLPPHSVLVAMYGATVGEYGIIAKPMACNQAVCALLPNANYSYPYLYKLIKNSRERLKNMAVGSAQQNISQILIKQLPIHAHVHKVKQFCDAVATHFQTIETLTLENTRLALIRDCLLPKLMSGEIDISDVQL